LLKNRILVVAIAIAIAIAMIDYRPCLLNTINKYCVRPHYNFKKSNKNILNEWLVAPTDKTNGGKATHTHAKWKIFKTDNVRDLSKNIGTDLLESCGIIFNIFRCHSDR
jgi:hypothetical protein